MHVQNVVRVHDAQVCAIFCLPYAGDVPLNALCGAFRLAVIRRFVQKSGDERVPTALVTLRVEKRFVANGADNMDVIFLKRVFAPAAGQVFLDVLDEMVEFVQIHGVRFVMF